MSVTNTNEITKVIIGTDDNECLLSGSNWFHAQHASTKGSYPSFVLQPHGDNDAYTAGKNSGLIVSARNPCYRYLQIEISDWRVEDWYRRRVTLDDDTLENNYGSYDYLDIYIGRPLNDDASSYTETFWARLGGASYSTLQVAGSGNGIDDYYRSYHEGTIRTLPGDTSKKFVIDMAQAWSTATSQTDDYSNPRYAYYLTGAAQATENGVDTRPTYLPTGSIAYVVFYWHSEINPTSLVGSMGRWFEITCSFHEKITDTAFVHDASSVYGENVLQRQNPGFMQYPAGTLLAGTTPGLTSSIEGDIAETNRTGPPPKCCPTDQWDDVIAKESPTNFTATATGDNCDQYGTVELQWTEVTSSTGYTRYNIYVDDGTSGVTPSNSSTYASLISPIWGTCFPPPNTGGSTEHPGEEPSTGWTRPGENVGGAANAGQTQSGSGYTVSHIITGVDTSQTYKYWLQAVDICGTSTLISADASFTTTDLTCSSPYYYDEDFTIDYYKCLHMQFNRKGAVPGQYCPPDHVPFAYGTKGVTIRYPKTPYSGNLG